MLESNNNATPCQPITLRAHLLSKKTFRSSRPAFDVDLLSEDDSSMYIRSVTPSIRYIVDKITFIKERICERKFTLLESMRLGKFQTKDMSTLIDHAYSLINKGWKMDDLLLKNDTWVVAKWGDLAHQTNTIRTSVTHDVLTKVTNCDECCLCQEKFKDNDIVISTSCSHNHHWICPHDGCSGLKYWVKEQKKSCCPFCRTAMF